MFWNRISLRLTWRLGKDNTSRPEIVCEFPLLSGLPGTATSPLPSHFVSHRALHMKIKIPNKIAWGPVNGWVIQCLLHKVLRVKEDAKLQRQDGKSPLLIKVESRLYGVLVTMGLQYLQRMVLGTSQWRKSSQFSSLSPNNMAIRKGIIARHRNAQGERPSRRAAGE